MSPGLAGQTVVSIGGSAGIGLARNASSKMRPEGIDATDCAGRSRSGASSGRPTSPRSRCTLMTNTALTGATYDIDGASSSSPEQ
jgi:hypothetical protein